MCFNETASWIAFIGISIVNIASMVYMKEEKYTAIALIFQWVLLMQLFDALAWRNQDCNSTMNNVATRGAFFANVTQPIVAFLLFMVFLSDSTTQIEKGIATIVMLFYIIWLLNGTMNVKMTCLQKGDGCSNLNYYWWDILQPGFMYHISLILVILILLKPLKLSLAISGIIMGTLAVSMIYYSINMGNFEVSMLYKNCGIASTWCFFAAFIPLFNMLAYKYLRV